jgi:hypothetical protein
MYLAKGCLLTALISVPLTLVPMFASDLIEGDFKSNLVPNPVPYSVLLPDGAKDGPALPLLVYLHGGGGSRTALTNLRGIFDELWKSGRLPKMVVREVGDAAGRPLSRIHPEDLQRELRPEEKYADGTLHGRHGIPPHGL